MEEWKEIKGFEGRYEVSSLGRIRSIPPMSKKIRIRKNFVDKDGYEGCLLRSPNKYNTKKVHRLVAEAFIPNPDAKHEVNHKNGNKKDNRAANLEWASHSENQRHKNRVLKKYNGWRPPKKVMNQETGEIFGSYIEAAESVGLKKSCAISNAISRNGTCGGFHWEQITV